MEQNTRFKWRLAGSPRAPLHWYILIRMLGGTIVVGPALLMFVRTYRRRQLLGALHVLTSKDNNLENVKEGSKKNRLVRLRTHSLIGGFYQEGLG